MIFVLACQIKIYINGCAVNAYHTFWAHPFALDCLPERARIHIPASKCYSVDFFSFISSMISFL